MMKVSQKEKQRRRDIFSAKCQEHKFPLTPQKTAIFEYLSSVTTHPTADEVFDAIQKQFPTLSPATVYKNLQKFVALGILREIRSTGRKSRYDARTDQHHHLVLSNGSIEDVEIDAENIPLPKGLSEEDISRVSVTFFAK